MPNHGRRKPYYCLMCNKFSFTDNHNACFEFKLMSLRMEMDRLSEAWDALEYLYSYVEEFQDANMNLDLPED